ncbi:MAG: DUF2249 domain-containing protein [Alphaproteobacteria bacterium]|nr:DUF2249 domain-containing protein [Alphaproteobacteria bacterium]
MTTFGFSRDTRVADALARRPALRRLLPAFHPAFERLNHPVLGRVLPRLVTLGDAARVAGVDPDALVEICNLPGPPSGPPPPTARRMDPEPAWLKGAPLQELDLRPILDAGEEPFPHVFSALRALPVGAVLRLRVGFEPAPLLRLLGKRGWRDHVTWSGEDCLVSLWRPPEASLPEPLDPGGRLVDGVLDLRGLEPPMPLRLSLSALETTLPLTLLHDREPALLYPRLEERGLTWSVEREGEHLRIRIHAP